MADNAAGILGICIDCISLNGSSWAIAYAAFIAYVWHAHSHHQQRALQETPRAMADLGHFPPPQLSPQTMIIQGISSLLTPYKYINILKYVSEKIESITGISKRSFSANIFVFFLFYYLVVSAPAAVMFPVKYDVKYDLQSISALFAMMLTNAAGDVISLKITIKNAKKLTNLYVSNIDRSKLMFKDSIKAEIALYRTTIEDMILALLVCVGVLILTSVYFGVSIGEYKFGMTHEFMVGAIDRIGRFWETSLEPYWIRKEWSPSGGKGWPMLLLYSISSFIPSFIFIIFSIFWTILMPIRIILFSNINKNLKIIVSEVIVFLMCSLSLLFFRILS